MIFATSRAFYPQSAAKAIQYLTSAVATNEQRALDEVRWVRRSCFSFPTDAHQKVFCRPLNLRFPDAYRIEQSPTRKQLDELGFHDQEP